MKKISIFIVVALVALSSRAYSIDTTAKQAILIDFSSGEILFKKNEDHKISPASLTKIMTSIVAFDLIKKGQLKLDEKITISTKAWRMSKQGYSSYCCCFNRFIKPSLFYRHYCKTGNLN